MDSGLRTPKSLVQPTAPNSSELKSSEPSPNSSDQVCSKQLELQENFYIQLIYIVISN